MTKICPKCKTKNGEGSRFCSSCRYEFKEVAGQLGRLCPAGLHTMDPNWSDCPYCRSLAEAPAAPGGGANKENKLMRDRTSIGESGEPQHRVTKVEPDGMQQPVGKIVGLLLSYSRNPMGEIFPIREGKNMIGSGERDGRPADILFADDHKMSAAHALILFRRGRFVIADQDSTNGTMVNGEETDKMDLPNKM